MGTKLRNSESVTLSYYSTEGNPCDDNTPTLRNKEPEKDDGYFKYKISKQICLGLVYVSIGLGAEMVGPTLPDLTEKIGVNYEEISRSLVGKSVGTMIGAVGGGFLHEALYRQTDLITTVALLILATGTFLTPFSVSVPMAFTCFLLGGISEGLINTGANTMVMHLWAEKAAAPMHSMHFGFGLGALLAPQIARPFLSGEEDNQTIEEPYNTTMSATETTATSQNLESRIEIPYSIVGVLIVVFSLVMLGFYIKGPPKGFPIRRNTTNFKNMASPGACGYGNVAFGLSLIICISFYFVHVIGGERAYGKFLFSYAYELNLMDKDQASILQSLFWLSFTTGRLLGIPLTKYLPLSVVITGDICLNIFSACMLALFANENVNVLWICTCLMGFGISVGFPNGMSWANIHLMMNSVAVMVLIVGGSCGGFVYQYLTGYLFENDGPQTLMYVMVGYGALLAISYVTMVFVAYMCKNMNNSYTINEETNFDMSVEISKEKF